MNENLLCSGLFGKTRQVVLALLFGRADSAFYTKQIIDAVKIGRGTVQRELKNLTDTGIIIREKRGRQVYYRANARCPIFNELKSIFTKSTAAGPGKASFKEISRRFPVSRKTLAAFCLKNHIKKLSLFGSALRDDFKPDSDI